MCSVCAIADVTRSFPRDLNHPASLQVELIPTLAADWGGHVIWILFPKKVDIHLDDVAFLSRVERLGFDRLTPGVPVGLCGAVRVVKRKLIHEIADPPADSDHVLARVLMSPVRTTNAGYSMYEEVVRHLVVDLPDAAATCAKDHGGARSARRDW